jgi:hypothetical protein
MPSHLKTRFREQHGKCFYCGFDAWLPTEGMGRAVRRLGMPSEGPGWRKGAARRMATKEHLHRRADGGPDCLYNYAMAHRWCNKVRGERSVEDHKAAIRKMIVDGKCKTAPNWLPETTNEKHRRSDPRPSGFAPIENTPACVGAD